MGTDFSETLVPLEVFLATLRPTGRCTYTSQKID